MRPSGRRDALLFSLALGGFLVLLLAAGLGDGVSWLKAAAPTWFIAATLVRFVLMTAEGGGPRPRSRTSAPPWG